MYGYMLQDWASLEADATITTITQSESDWMSFQSFQDIVFWLDVKSITLGGADSVTIAYETSPTKDEASFAQMATVTLAAGNAPTVTPILVFSNPSVPLARWVRWKLAFTGTADANWGATFRINCAANGG